MPIGRPAFGFALIDLPSDHEVDGGLATECQVISALLHNRNLGSSTKHIRATTKESFNRNVKGPYPHLGFVHLATHGYRHGISLIGDSVRWSALADALRRVAPPLKRRQQRVLCLSCCYSKYGYRAMRSHLKGHFTGCYFFPEKAISFASSMTVWAMFYRRKTVEKPAKAIVDAVNTYFGREVIEYDTI